MKRFPPEIWHRSNFYKNIPKSLRIMKIRSKLKDFQWNQNWRIFSENFNFRLKFPWKTIENRRTLSKNFNFLLNFAWKNWNFPSKKPNLVEIFFPKVNFGSIFIIHSSNFKGLMWIPSGGLPQPPPWTPCIRLLKPFRAFEFPQKTEF